MRLSIQNLAKIKNAEIELNGITVIAGDNDTGKSTVGKALYAMFNGFVNMDRIIHNQRCHSLANAIINTVAEIVPLPHKNSTLLGGNFGDIIEFSKVLQNEQLLTYDNIVERGKEYVLTNYNVNLNDILDDEKSVELERRIRKILQVTNEEISRQRVSNMFSRVFQYQINSLQTKNDASVKMQIKSNMVSTVISENICKSVEYDFNISHNAVCVDNPFVIDNVSSGFLGGDFVLSRDLATRLSDQIDIDVVTSIVNEKDLSKVFAIINQAVPGEFDKEDNKLVLRRGAWKEPLNATNLSAGVKAFAILKILIQNHQLREKDVLILDEPEIHLHPEWQILYAEFLVLFQKVFDLTILLTTHSPYFLNAIEVFSRKYDRLDKVNYYKTKVEDDNMVTLVDVTDSIDEIYGSMAAPFNRLNEMEQELGMES
ncbi:ABC transporter ATP-binding protein [Anaerovibrio sp. JC8]|uniref:AAA family ATPase n=1 Tax=Anaerovibrio sp. JC8 TaxID=1240085 RepID=UPI000A0B23E8|nr:AAA family ATPase [Anaerovibrio sp. JC8]ORU00999.1 ABC transporter ATP-binding protein [Anaerovibrio sp. JC8]